MLGKEDKFVFLSQGVFAKSFSQVTNDVFLKTSRIWDATRKAEATETAHQRKKKKQNKQNRQTHIKALKATQKPPT